MRRGQPNIFVPFDRKGIDPFTQRFPITLRYEGTVRGVGGLVIDGAGATTVPGLFAARGRCVARELRRRDERGGGPNSTWAMSTGARARAGGGGIRGGAGAACAGASRAAGRSDRPAARGFRSTKSCAWPMSSRLSKQEILPLDRSYFRNT